MIGPIIVEPGTAAVEATVGRNLAFAVEGDPADWQIESADPAVVEVIQGGKQGEAVMRPGGKALTKGSTTLTLTNSKDNTNWEVSVTVA